MAENKVVKGEVIRVLPDDSKPVGAGAMIQALATERDVEVELREERVAEEISRTLAECSFGWKANYGCCVSKAEGERRRREAMEQARQRAQREAEAAQREAEAAAAAAQREAEAEARRQAKAAARARQLEVAAKTRAELEAKFPGLKAQYEAARANGAPNDTVRDARDARARAPLRRVRRGERAARARDSDARRPPPPAGEEPRGTLRGGERRRDGGRP